MLCYAWDVNDQLNKVKVDGEHCHSLENLLTTVLVNACDQLLRKGLIREYRFREQEIYGIKGKINLTETIRNNKYKQGKTICNIDELTNNVLINQIIYSTLKRITKLNNLDYKVRERVRKTIRKYPRLQEVNITKGTFERIRLNRNNRFYIVLPVFRQGVKLQ